MDDQRKRDEEAAEKYANQFIAVPVSEEERLINSEIVQAISGHVLFGANLVMERVRRLEEANKILKNAVKYANEFLDFELRLSAFERNAALRESNRRSVKIRKETLKDLSDAARAALEGKES